MLLSRHSSVVSRVPQPLTSIEPPSITTRVSQDNGRNSRAPVAFAIRLPIFSSCRQLEYLAQALKRNLRASRLESGAKELEERFFRPPGAPSSPVQTHC